MAFHHVSPQHYLITLSARASTNCGIVTPSGNLFVLLANYIKERDLGKLFHAPIDLILESTSVLQPDLLFVAKARQHIITEKAIEGIPDLVIEILSPGTSRTDRVTKAQIHARYGVPAYWIVDPEQEVSRSIWWKQMAIG